MSGMGRICRRLEQSHAPLVSDAKLAVFVHSHQLRSRAKRLSEWVAALVTADLTSTARTSGLGRKAARPLLGSQMALADIG